MVKIRRRVPSRKDAKAKPAMNTKDSSSGIQKRFHDNLKPFLEEDLKMNVIEKENKLIIELSLKRPPANHL